MIIVIIYFYFNGHFFFLSSYWIIGDQIPVRTCYQARVSRYHLRCSGDWCPPLILAGYGMKFISFLMILSNVREEHISGLDIPEEMTLMWYEFKRLAVTLFNTNSNVMTGLKLHLSLVYGVPPTPRSQAWERSVGWVCNFNFSDCSSVAEPDSVLAWRQPDSLVWNLEGLPLGCLSAEGNASD